MLTLMQDIRFAWRRLRRSPAVSVGYVAVLAVGIGVNVAVLSMLNALVYRSLPIRDPGSLVSVSSYDKTGRERFIPFLAVRELQQQGPFSVVCGYNGGAILPFQVRQAPTQAVVTFVSGQCFETFGVTPILGRGITDADAPIVSPGNRVVVISHSFWARAFNRDPNAIGESIQADNVTATVVGVLPEGFGGLHIDTGIDVFAPPDTLLPSRADRRPNAGQILGRLRRGTTLAQASSELSARWPSLLAATTSATPSAEGSDLFGPTLRLQPMGTGLSTFRTKYSGALQVIFVLTLMLLLLVGINLGGLLSTKATSAAAELSIHHSLGGSRQRLAQQLLAESMLLALLGTALAAPVCLAIVSALSNLLPPGLIATSVSFLPDLNVWLAGLAGGVVMGLLIGMVPVLAVARGIQLTGADTGRTVVRNRNFTTSALLVAQVALSTVLVFGAGLLVRSLMQLQQSNLGLQPTGLLDVRLMSMPGGRRAADAREYYKRVLESVAATPGVRRVAFSQIFPRWTTLEASTAVAFSSDPLGDVRAVSDTVTPDFFDTVGIPVIAGRHFTWTDGADGRSVAMVSAGLARQLAPGGDVVGREIKYGTGKDTQRLVIVGVAGDASSGNPRRSDMPMVYLPLGIRTYTAPNLLVSSSAGDFTTISSSVRSILAAEGREYAQEAIPVEALFARAAASERMSVIMSLAVVAVALTVAILGLYVATSFAVARREREMGVRLAIGASPKRLALSVATEAYRVVVVGVVLGVPAALFASQWLSALLFNVRAFDAVTLVGTVVVFGLVGLVASFAPALRAARLDPIVALRAD